MNSKRALSSLLLILILLFTVSASEYRFSSFKMNSGLSNNSVFCMTQDSLGYMWIGTFGGLNRYDGTEYMIYKPDPANQSSLTSSVIFDVYEDSKGSIWVGTDGGGLNLYHRESDSFTSYRFDPNNPNSLSSNQVYTILEDSAAILWAGTGGGGLNRMTSEGTFVSYMADNDSPHALHSNIIRTILQDASGTIWVATDGGGLARYNADEDNFTSFTYSHTLNNEEMVEGRSIKSLFEDSQGRLWVGFEDNGLALFDPYMREFIPLPLTDDLTENISVRAINEDSQGRLWAGTDGSGLFIITDPLESTQRISHLEHEKYVSEGLNNDRVRDIFIDTTGLIWIGMRDGGINLFNPLSLSFARVTSSGEPPYALKNDQIREIVETDDHAIWAATDSGLVHRIDPETKEVSIPIDLSSQTKDSSFSLLSDGNYLWVGTDGNGLYQYDMKKREMVSHYTNSDGSGLKSNVIWDIFRDSKGTLWLGTENGGLHSFDEETHTFKDYRFETDNPHSILGNSVREIFEDSYGNLWIGTWDGGLNRFISEEEGFERFGFVPGNLNSLRDNSVNTIYEDSQRVLWIGTTGGGLNRFDRQNRTFSSYGVLQGFPSDNILGILEDDSENLWISTHSGLVRFNPASEEVVSFWKEDGLAGSEFSHKAYCKASDGRLYFGGSSGISYFSPDEIAPRTISSPFLLTGLSLQNKKITVGPLILEDSHESRSLLDRPLNENPTISLAPTDRFITFSFALFDFVYPSKNLYAVKLDGLDDHWTQLGTKNSITFATIPPGNYTLRISAIHYNGIPHGKELAVKINVDSFLYQKWYFILSIALISAMIILLIFRLRIRSLEAKNRQLRTYALNIQEAREKKGKSIAREIHDQLGQILTLLKFDIFRIAKTLKESEEISPEIKKTADSAIETIDTAIESVRTISTRLRPSALDSLSFSEAIQWQLSEFNRRTGIRISLDIVKESRTIPEEKAVMMYRIVQEILTNIIRHAQATEVYCQFHENDSEYYLQVADNGVGCTQKELNSKSAFGIISIRERCESLGGSVRISSTPVRKTAVPGDLHLLRDAVRQKKSLPKRGTRIEILIPVGKEGKT